MFRASHEPEGHKEGAQVLGPQAFSTVSTLNPEQTKEYMALAEQKKSEGLYQAFLGSKGWFGDWALVFTHIYRLVCP